VADIRNPKVWSSVGNAKLSNLQLVFNPDGRLLAAAGSGSRDIEIWNVSDVTRPTIAQQREARAEVRGLAFHPQFDQLAYGELYRGIFYWDRAANSVRSALALKGGNPFWGIQVDADGTALYAPPEIWDFEKGDELAKLPAGGLAFNRDRSRIAVLHDDEMRIRVFDVKPTMESLCTRANRNLTMAEWNLYVGADVDYEKTCPALPAGPDVDGAGPKSWFRKLADKIQ